MDLLVLPIPVIVAGMEPGSVWMVCCGAPSASMLTKSMRTGFLALDEATQQRVGDAAPRNDHPAVTKATAHISNA